MGATREDPSIIAAPRRRSPRLAVHTPVEMNRRVDPERDGTVRMNGAGLALGVRPDELDRICVGWVVLLVDGRDDIERDPQLLEDRAPLRRGRSEDERIAHRRFLATQISSLGHLRDHSTEKAS